MSKYWTHVEEFLVQDWRTADRKKQFEIYDKLYPKLKFMAGSILGRFFIPTYDHDEVRQDAINKVFLTMHKFNPELGHTAFSYCQTVIKNYYNDVCKNKGKLFAISLEYYDDLLLPEFEYSYSFNPLEEDDFNFEAVFKRLETARWKLVSYINQHKKMRNGVKASIKNEVNYLTYVTEYFFTYKDSTITRADVFDYMGEKMKISEATLNKYMKKHLNITGTTTRKREVRENIDYIQDDFPLKTNASKIYRTRKINKNNF